MWGRLPTCGRLVIGLPPEPRKTACLCWGRRIRSLCLGKYLKVRGLWGIVNRMALTRPEPIELHDRAMDNLRYIRRTIEQAGSFTAVPGLGGVLMGSTALVAAWIAGPRTPDLGWLMVWLAEAVVALMIGIFGAAVKSRSAGMPLLSGPGRKFVAGFAPSMIAGVVLSAVLFRAGLGEFLPGVWLLLYGAAVLSGGWASVSSGRCLSSRGIWRVAHYFRDGDCDSLWRLNRTRRGAPATRNS
jgi:hypothetical protein